MTPGGCAGIGVELPWPGSTRAPSRCARTPVSSAQPLRFSISACESTRMPCGTGAPMCRCWTRRSRAPRVERRAGQRSTEDARRALFFARLNVGRRDEDIAGIHILAGLLMSANVRASFGGALLEHACLLRPATNAQALLQRLDADPARRTLAPHPELPFSPQAKLATGRAVEEADALGQADVGPEHVLLGLLLGATTTKARRLIAAVSVSLPTSATPSIRNSDRPR